MQQPGAMLSQPPVQPAWAAERAAAAEAIRQAAAQDINIEQKLEAAVAPPVMAPPSAPPVQAPAVPDKERKEKETAEEADDSEEYDEKKKKKNEEDDTMERVELKEQYAKHSRVKLSCLDEQEHEDSE